MSRLPRHLFQIAAALAVSGIAALWLAPAASAHVRWFVDSDHYPPDWDRLIAWPTLMVVGLTLGLLGTLLAGQRMLGQHFPNPAFLAYMEPSATTLLAVHTGISLVFFASQRDLFDASHALDGRVIVAVFVILQVVAAFALITGLVARGGAALLAGTWLLAFIAFKPWQVLDLTLYVGIGIALFVLGRTIPPPAVAARLLGLPAAPADRARADRFDERPRPALVLFTVPDLHLLVLALDVCRLPLTPISWHPVSAVG